MTDEHTEMWRRVYKAPVTQPFAVPERELSAARGIATGLVVALVLWGIAALALWAWLR